MGDGASYRAGKFPLQVMLIANDWVQVRDNALEAGRMMFSKILDEKIPNQYYFEIKTHPHHILRNNKTAAGAGADRLSTGMKQSFGVIEGRAAMVGAGKPIFFVACATENAARVVREVMHMAKAKIPGKTSIRFEKS
jgi:large subunit ribosomal protein L10e